MNEPAAKDRYYWSKIRQAMKLGDALMADYWLEQANDDIGEGLKGDLREKLANTFTAGLAALGDPAPLDKEQDNG